MLRFSEQGEAMKGNTNETNLKQGTSADPLTRHPAAFENATVGITHEPERPAGSAVARRLQSSKAAVRTMPSGNMITPAILKRLGLEVPKLT